MAFLSAPSVAADEPTSKRLRICVIGPSHYFYSGVSNYTVMLANGLAERHDVSVLYLRKLAPKALYPLKEFLGGKMGYVRTDSSIRAFDGVDYHSPLSWRRGVRFLRREMPDVVILQWWTAAVAHMYLPLVREAERIGAKILVEMHEVIDPTEAAVHGLQRYSKVAFGPLRKRAQAFIAHSERDANLIAKEYGLRQDAIHVIPHGLYDYGEPVDREEARRLWHVEDSFAILQFGSVRRYKGTTMLLDAFDALDPEIASRSRLLICGGLWDDAEEIRQRVGSSPNAAQITLSGAMIPDEQMPGLFAASDVVTLPYIRASQSGVAAIGMAHGKPIIATRVGGLEEGLRDYPGTRFIDVEVDALTRAITQEFHQWASGNTVRFKAPARRFSDTARLYDGVIAAAKGV